MDTEVLDRTRRIETRLTRLIQALGFDPGSQKPVYDSETLVLHVPSPHVSLSECMLAIPEHENVEIRVKGEVLGWVSRRR